MPIAYYGTKLRSSEFLDFFQTNSDVNDNRLRDSYKMRSRPILILILVLY